jgi:hypothetical protein
MKKLVLAVFLLVGIAALAASQADPTPDDLVPCAVATIN